MKLELRRSVFGVRELTPPVNLQLCCFYCIKDDRCQQKQDGCEVFGLLNLIYSLLLSCGVGEDS